jgi:hypothetical protein
MEKPNRFTATPEQIMGWLRSDEGGFAEDVLLRFQQAIGSHAVSEAAHDMRLEADKGAAEEMSPELHEAFAKGANFIDPAKGGGPFPSRLIRFHGE